MQPSPFGSRAELEAHQLARLRALVAELLERNPFWRAKLAAAGCAEPPASLEDFRARFPFTRKDELVRDQAAAPPWGSNLSFPIEDYTRLHWTSATTGAPLAWLDTPADWDFLCAAWMRVLVGAGIGRGDRALFAFSFGPFLGFWMGFEAAARLGCLCIPGGALSSAARLATIVEHGVTVVCCTPTYALRLGEEARSLGVELGRARVRALVVAGETGGSTPATRARLEELWPGAEVFDHYGMTEVGPVTYQTPGRPEVVQVNEEAYLAEVVALEDGPEGGASEVGGARLGELVLTPLGRVGRAVLRYRTGDLVRPRALAEPSALGTGLELEGGILARADDMVVVRGVNLWPSAVDELVRAAGGAGEYRVLVRERRGMVELELEVEPAPGAAADGLDRRLAEAFERRWHLRVPVRAVPAGSLPRFELKARRWLRSPGAGQGL